MYLVPVIMSGGAGSRLWPLTHAQKPKPLLALANGKTLLGETLERACLFASMKDDKHSGHILTVTGRNCLHATLAEYGVENQRPPPHEFHHHFIVEPLGRDTAPAVILSCLYAVEQLGKDAVLLFMPADHRIDDIEGFARAAHEAAEIALQGKLVSLGTKADNANTAYGYIKAMDGDVLEFTEKPGPELAQQYSKSGKHFWNTGIFCCQAEILLELLQTHCSKLVNQCRKTMAASHSEQTPLNSTLWLNEDGMRKIQGGSIDHLLFEKLTGNKFVEAKMDWSDIGSWDSVGCLFEPDEFGNNANAMAFAEDSRNCIAYGTARPVGILGLENVIVVDTPEGILVADRSQSQNVRKLHRKISGALPSMTAQSGNEIRPWGKFRVLMERPGYKVKQLVVDPHGSLSLQSHHHRNEHWVVVEGEASIVVGDKNRTLGANEAVHIPAGEKHRISNMTSKRLVIIETQTGDYLGEDDEIRYEDDYGRADHEVGITTSNQAEMLPGSAK